ncbi:hypothetical protein ISN45_At01g035770 [Arabidopsis thaliana x Arabidopsis arenosa]|uniref:Uncharacterized protein n=1 Tax=Arabidopsis thaliana x Arabidopsis arenosa TaxID=1240361 RepID=A0A8T2GME5_9BRAS|nr:hypothetical protein ISN45_At01g035770 [Arabidopsis thaliana x Arabidopsis arenosa]
MAPRTIPPLKKRKRGVAGGTKPIDAVTKATKEPPTTTEKPSATEQNLVAIEGGRVEEEPIPTIIPTVVEEGEQSDNNEKENSKKDEKEESDEEEKEEEEKEEEEKEEEVYRRIVLR